ncbi:MAG TPA: porin family protein [Bryobacteraceae bacterium]|nr:porin family protein [Bryobacteraceae bacterium]
MRILVLLLGGVALAAAQPFSFGVKGGVPLTDFVNAVNSDNFGYFSSTNRYTVGPTVELHLPFGLGVEFDALYRHLHYSSVSNGVDVLINSSTKSGSWEFPLLLKYRFKAPLVRPFVDGGVAWNTLSGLTQTVTETVIPSGAVSTSTNSNPAELRNSTVTGVVLGGGLEIHVPLLRISPEIRYTRWTSPQFQSPSQASIPAGPSQAPVPSATGSVSSNQNQVEFLVGITF